MRSYKRKSIKMFSAELAKKIILSLIVVIIFDFFLFPIPVLANKTDAIFEIDGRIEDVITQAADKDQNTLPVNKDLPIKWTGTYTVTAYNSEASQCDSSPCVTANGFNVCGHGVEDTVAANFLPFGARVKIPDLFGDRVFVVRDRMNARYNNRLDIWMIERQDAVKFGVKLAKIEILE